MVGLRKAGASVGATLAYWLGNPVLNPATIIFMGFVLGWQWSLLRIVVGVLLVAGVAMLGDRYGRHDAVPDQAVKTLEDGLRPNDAGLIVTWGKNLLQLVIGLIPEYVVIVLVLGAARAWLFPAMTPTLGHSLLLVLGLAIAGTLFVIPTAGEIPIVQSLLGFGLGSGSAAALMITLPAVSLPSLFMVGRAVETRVLVRVGVLVFLAGLVAAAAAMVFGI